MESAGRGRLPGQTPGDDVNSFSGNPFGRLYQVSRNRLNGTGRSWSPRSGVNISIWYTAPWAPDANDLQTQCTPGRGWPGVHGGGWLSRGESRSSTPAKPAGRTSCPRLVPSWE